MTRGERNHNPLNIRLTRDKWVGRCSEQTDSQFVQFKSDVYGFRAGFRIIHNGFKQGRNTIRKIITRWAPPNENNTANYISFVSTHSVINPDAELDYDNIISMCVIVQAMAKMETGRTYPLDVIGHAYRIERGLA